MKRTVSCLLLATSLLISVPENSFSQEADATAEMQGIPFKWAPWKDPENPDVIKLRDDKDHLFLRRDTSKDPKREPGLFYPNRYVSGPIWTSIPTFLGAPIAQTPEDLKAAEVDVALVGLTVGDQVIPGGRFGALKMRSLTDYMFYPVSGTDNHIGVDYSKLVVADYGNIAANWQTDNQYNLDEIHKVVTEILDTGAIPIGIAGTHIQSYPFITALAEKYGKGEFVSLHIDAHYDAYSAGTGRFVHNGSYFKTAVDLGLINGSDLIQLGLRGTSPKAKDFQWMRDNGLKFHFQSEIEKDGWDAVLGRLLAELKGKKVHITFDMDGIDPAYAPGVGSSDPDGLTAAQALQLMRAVGIQNEIVAAEFNEYNPFLDDTHGTTGILMDRLIRSLLAGIQGKREGIEDPLYLDPERLSHDSDGN